MGSKLQELILIPIHRYVNDSFVNKESLFGNINNRYYNSWYFERNCFRNYCLVILIIDIKIYDISKEIASEIERNSKW